MAGLTLDAGPLIAWDRGDRLAHAWIAEAQERKLVPRVAAPVIAEVWRGGRRSARLAHLLKACRVDPADDPLARYAGELLGACGGDSTIDALVVAHAARCGDDVLTTDPQDLTPLAQRAGVRLIEF